MRIVFLLPMGIERPSGRRYFHIARGLVGQGHQVRILALHPDLAHTMRRFIQDGVEVWYVGQMHARKQGTLPERFRVWELLGILLKSTLGMLWGILCSPADFYHLGKPQPINGVAAVVGVRLLRRQPFYVDCDDDEVGSNRLTAGWQRQVFAFWQLVLPKLATGITVNTPFLADRMRSQGKRRVVYVPNGVDLQHWTPPLPEQLRVLKNALGLQDRRVVAYLGTLALHNHPVDLLLAAWSEVTQTIPDVDLLIIGGGEDLLLLREQVHRLGMENRVYFVGHIDQCYVPPYLALAEVSVDPVYDNVVARARSPLKIFESMALGVPVVTGDVGDRAVLLDHGGAGILVTPGSVAALVTALLEILREPIQQRTMKMNARSFVQQYDWNTLSGMWATVYQRNDQAITGLN